MRHPRTLYLLALAAILCAGAREGGASPAPQEVVRDRYGKQVLLYEASYALVVGVGDYTAGWPDLPGVRGDVEAVTALLQEHGFEVETLLDPTVAFANALSKRGGWMADHFCRT